MSKPLVGLKPREVGLHVLIRTIFIPNLVFLELRISNIRVFTEELLWRLKSLVELRKGSDAKFRYALIQMPLNTALVSSVDSLAISLILPFLLWLHQILI